MSLREDVNTHYSFGGIFDAVMGALCAAGIAADTATVDDLAPIDQYHTGGLAATRYLADRLEIGATDHVLDAGCGVGGPARWLAANRGCSVTGIDLAAELIAAGTRLNKLLGFADSVTLRTGDISDTGLGSASVDVVWCQNVFMNVADKAATLAEFDRVLKPGGTAAVQQMVRLTPGDFEYPLFWASRADMNFIPTEEEFRSAVAPSGLELTEFSLGLPVEPDAEPDSPALHPGVLMGLDLAELTIAETNVGAAVGAGLIGISLSLLVKSA